MVSDINKVSNPSVVRKKFSNYKGNDDAVIKLSEKPDKKYKVIHDGKTTHFGSTLPDFTKHRDPDRRKNYLARSGGIKGDWKKNKYSANNLSRNLLW
tara:strand:+ start:190 stop:480 length:291 start_codon:yes stop_codon:yes gene_type:complete